MPFFNFKNKHFDKNRYLIAAILIAVAFLIINTANLGDYGETVDETYSMTRGRGTTEYITQVFKTSNLDFKIWNKQVQFHPPFFSTLNYWFSNLTRKFLGLGQIESYHLLIVIISSIGLFFLFLLARAMFDERVGLYSLIFFIFFPRFIAHSHYNPKDIPVMVFLIIAIFFFYLALKKSNKDYSILAGLFAGMSIDSKLDGLFIVPIFLLSYIFYQMLNFVFLRKDKNRQKIMLKKDLIIFLIFFVSASIAVFLFWPYLWGDPLFMVKSLKHFSGTFTSTDVLYFGKLYSAQKAPWHYVPFTVFMITPVITLILFLAGFFVLIKKQIKDKKIFEHSLLIFWFLIPLVARSIGKLKYNEDRQLFSIIPAMAIIAALSLDYLFLKIKFYLPEYGKKLVCIIFITIVIILFKEVVIIHPFEGGYVNETIRLFIPSHIEKHFYLDYWGSVYRQGMEWLDKNAEKNSQVCLSHQYLGLHNEKRKDIILKCDGKENYIMRITRFDLVPSGYYLIFKISIYKNSDLLHIYKVNPVKKGEAS